MDGLSISKVAAHTGFSPSALRFYEKAGLVTPARTPAGYRSYDEASVRTLRFIARAKGMGLSLEEISELVTMLDDRRCRPVQDRLRQLLHAKLDDARTRLATLDGSIAELQRAAARLDLHTPEGPCDAGCGCTGEPATTTVQLGRPPQVPPADVPIACTLGAGAVQTRLAEWQAALDGALRCDAVAGGVRVHLPGTTALTHLAALIEAERCCCRFLSFTLAVTADEVVLEIGGPAGAEAIVHALAGAARPAT